MATPPSRVSASSSSAGPLLKSVGTPNSTFHCDEALGCFMISLTNEFSDTEIARTRPSAASLIEVKNAGAGVP
ncbi:hypothetical protein NL676_011088 [Syzygium grande]|nr:hypothetical protein NL676_011088 [Syzygium grande]